ncbi:MAG: NUDIX domain-containing protein [Methylacidiphilales bacterium]|nr:NUDIX domain-containing protein [Candidatus Methylacidiphilales bacterium]
MNPRAEKMFAHNEAVPGTQIKTGVGVIIRNDNGHFLLEKRSDCGLWGVLGGRVDPGEEIAETARREVLEESGFQIEITGLVGVYSHPAGRIVIYPDNDDIRHLIDIIVEARIVGGSLRLSSESERIEFFPPGQLPALEEIMPPARRPIADALAGHRGVLR